MRTLHLVLPDGVDDVARPSGGNVYDRRIAQELAALGWRVVEHVVPGPWPRADAEGPERLAAAIATVPAGDRVLVDGLIASASPDVLVPAARRVALGVLVHLPLGVAEPAAREQERRVLAAARTIVATSAWTRSWLAGHYGLQDVVAAPPGVDAAPAASGSPGGGRLLVVGRASRVKGYDVLAAALHALPDLTWTCVWVGPVEAAPAARIALTGPMTPRDLAARYDAADLLVLPSRVETYGMVLTEALARGVPVLASDVGGVREAIGHDAAGRIPGILVPPGDPAALAQALRRWLSDADLRATLRRAALDRRTTLAGWADTAALIDAALTTRPDTPSAPRSEARLGARL